MQCALLQASRKQSFAFYASAARASVASTSRTISTRPDLNTSRSISNSSLQTKFRPFDEGFRINGRRNYWWSSKPSDKTKDVAAVDSSAGRSVEGLSPAQQVLKEKANAAPSAPSTPIQDTTTAASTASPPFEPISAATPSINPPPVESIIPMPPDALASTEALDTAITEFAALASTDFSHLFSWVWPPGVFLRTYSLVTEYIHVTSPVLGLVVAFLLLRVWLSPMQLRAQRAQARFAPYQDEWFGIQEKFKMANLEGDKLKAATLAKRMMEIKEKTDIKPFAPLLPGIGMAMLGIGGFIGAGRLVIHHKEVVEMGGVGPLAYPGGLFGTGILEDLTAFSPVLLVIMTVMTWISTRRGALDAAKYSKWMVRMPWLMTPPAFALGYIAHFSSAQMIVATTSIGYTVLQSYLLRVPAIRSALGMQDMKVQDPKELDFPNFITAWKDTLKDWQNLRMKKIQEAQEEARRNAERRDLRMRSLGIHDMGLSKSELRVKDAPSSIVVGSPPAPLPPRHNANSHGLFESAENPSAGRTLPPEAIGPPKPASKPSRQGKGTNYSSTKVPKKAKT